MLDFRGYGRKGRRYENDESDFSVLPIEDREVSMDSIQMPLYEMHQLIKQGSIHLQTFRPDDHRTSAELWTNSRSNKSRLIESTLMHLPLAPIYLVQLAQPSHQHRKYVVVDGRKRLKIFTDFFFGKFNLTGLKVLFEHNEKAFKDLEANDRRKLEDHKIQIFIIKATTSRLLQFDLVQRLHIENPFVTGQEIRHLIFSEDMIDFLNGVAEFDEVKQISPSQLRFSPLHTSEAVLRFYAFHIFGIEEYPGDLDLFLNLTLERLDKMISLDYDHFQDIRMSFNHSVTLIRAIFGDLTFLSRVRLPRMKSNVQGSLILFELLSTSFARHNKEIILSKKSQIIAFFNDMVEHDNHFRSTFATNPYSKAHVFERFQRWNTALDACLVGGDHTQ